MVDAETILNEIKNALMGELSDGYSAISAFIDRQGTLLAKQAAFIARERATGFLREEDDLFDFFLKGMQRDTENMTRSITMLTVITLEKAWNAVAEVLWGSVRAILKGAGIPDTLLPETPPSP